MAVVNVMGVNYAKVAAGVKPESYLGPEVEGKVRCVWDYVELTAADANSTIKMGLLKPGETFLGMFISWDDQGSGTTLEVGDGTDSDAFVSSFATSTAGSAFCGRPSEANIGLGYKNTGKSDIIITGTLPSDVSTGTIAWVIFKASF